MEEFRNIPLLKITLALILGIILGNSLGDQSFLAQIGVIGIIFAVSVFCFSNYYLHSVLLIGLAFLIGIFSVSYRNIENQKFHFSKLSNSHSYLIFEIVSKTQKTSGTRAQATVTHIGNHPDSLYNCYGNMMIYLKGISSDSLEIGSTLMGYGKHEEQTQNTNPHVFNYKRYLNHRGIFHRCFLNTGQYHIITHKTENLIVKASRIGSRFQKIFASHLNTDNNKAVATAMILGQRNLISNDLYDAFTDTGAVHVLAVSGLHVGILSKILLMLMSCMPKSKVGLRILHWALLITALWFFALLTGAAPAVIRATTMATLYFSGKLIYRNGTGLIVLITSAFLMLLYNPLYLFQAGFQFSFLALFGILYINPWLVKKLVIKNKFLNAIWQLIALACSAQLLVSPLATFYFHKLPLLFWLSGIIVVPMAGIILWNGLSLLLSHFTLGADNIVTTITGQCFDGILSFFNLIVFQIQKIPYCSADNLWVSNNSLLLIYLAIALAGLGIRLKNSKLIIAATMVIFLQSLLHLHENTSMRKVKKLVIYDIYDNSLVDVFYQGGLSPIMPSETDENKLQYNCLNNRLYNRVTAKADIELEHKSNFYQIDNQLFLIHPTDESLLFQPTADINLLVLSKNSISKLDIILKSYKVKKLILDGTVKQNEKLIKRIDNYKIPYHFTSSSGAYEHIL